MDEEQTDAPEEPEKEEYKKEEAAERSDAYISKTLKSYLNLYRYRVAERE